MSCNDSQMPIPHLSIGLILYEPSTESSQKYSDNVIEEDNNNVEPDSSTHKTFFNDSE